MISLSLHLSSVQEEIVDRQVFEGVHMLVLFSVDEVLHFADAGGFTLTLLMTLVIPFHKHQP